MRQVYSTVISWERSPFEPIVVCETFPKALFAETRDGWPTDEESVAGFLRDVGLEPGVPLPTGEDVAGFIFAGFNQRRFAFGDQSSDLWKSRMNEGGPFADFARQAAFEAEIPVVASPLSGQSLSSLASAGISLTAGAPTAVGHVLSFGGGVILTGEVLVGYVAGWGAYALGRSLFYHLHRVTRTPLPPGFRERDDEPPALPPST